VFQNLRFNIRALNKQPGFTIIAVLTLALGIGATSAVFSLVQGVLLTPPPYDDPQHLVLIPPARTDGRPAADSQGWAALEWLEWQKQAKSFASVAAYDWSFNFIILQTGSMSVEGIAVTKEYFPTLGLRPVLGRTFSAADTALGSTPVIILGYDLWQRQYNGDRSIIGKTIRLSRFKTPPTVIGIMPPGVRFLPSPTTAKEPNYNPNAVVDFWLPAAPDPKHLKELGWNVVARLNQNATANQAESELSGIVAHQARMERDFEGMRPQIEPLETELNRDGRRILFPLLGAAAIVLLIACGNTASLLLVRGLQRQPEYAVRSALGIRRIALLGQASAEGLLIAIAGGALGIALAFGIIKAVKLVGAHAIPRLDSVNAGWPILLCGLLAAIASAALACFVPALRAVQLDPAEVLKSAGPRSSASRGERRLLSAVAIFQTALTLALLVGAGLLVRTMENLAKVQSGYDVSHILTMSVTAVQGDRMDFHGRALVRISALSGIEHAAFAWGVPLTGNNWPGQVDVEGQPAPAKQSDRLSFPMRSVTPGYFAMMHLPVLEGRDFRATDNGKQIDVAIVNRAFAARYFPHQSVIGKRFWFDTRAHPGVPIIGVVSNARNEDLTQAAQPEIYLSFWEATPFSKHLVIRTASDSRSAVAAVLRELRRIDPTVAVENIKTLDEIRSDSLASRTFAMQLLVGFSVVGTILTLIGIYGVLALSVASRRREIAIRTAVGAERRDIRNLVFAQAFRLIAGGILAGSAAAIVLSRVLQSFLFGVAPADPATLIGVGILFTGVAFVACWIPTHRAVKVNPVDALRYE
jgi:putative ABC transport system permease protein